MTNVDECSFTSNNSENLKKLNETLIDVYNHFSVLMVR